MKDSTATKKYSYNKIVIPFVITFILPIIIIMACNIIGINIEINLDSILKINMDNINSILSKIIVYIILFILIKNFFMKVNCENVLYDGDIYGSYNRIFYSMAVFVGYKKISLVMKPYKMILLILSKKKFSEIYFPNEQELNGLVLGNDYIINEKAGNTDQVNLIISDTYDITEDYIPEKYKQYKHIKFTRITKKNIRVTSKEFIEEIGKVINKLKDERIKFNLFMTTSVSNTKYLFENYILLGDRHYINLEVFQMVTFPSRRFLEKGYNYKRGK